MAAIDIFRFKKFDIKQNQLVHRVGTDGVLLGAWVNIHESEKILDIGTGTGLIALMLAQRGGVTGSITAIEPDPASFELAVENVRQSSFCNQITTINTNLQNFLASTQFDLIVCNAPFFENSLKPPSAQRRQARHSESLPFQVILGDCRKLMTPSGRLAIILPVDDGNRFINLAGEYGLPVVRQCAVFSKASKAQERWLLEFAFESPRDAIKESLTIMDSTGHWTEKYKVLTQPFYLKF